MFGVHAQVSFDYRGGDAGAFGNVFDQIEFIEYNGEVKQNWIWALCDHSLAAQHFRYDR